MGSNITHTEIDRCIDEQEQELEQILAARNAVLEEGTDAKHHNYFHQLISNIMRKLFLFLTATILSLTASAQWELVTPSSTQSGEHVILATIDGITPNDGLTVGAFIDGGCRAIADATELMDVTGAPLGICFTLRVPGGTEDAGKNITFKVYDNNYSNTYTLTQTLAYVNEGHTGEYSNLYKLNFKKAEQITYTETEVELYPGSTYTFDYTVSPAGAQLPDDFDNNFTAMRTDAFTVSGKTVTAVTVGQGLVQNTTAGISQNSLVIKVVERPIPVTSITIDATKTTTLYVGDQISLSEYFTVNPSNATNKNVTVTANNNNVSIEESAAAANMFLLTATIKGTSVVTIESVEDPTIKATITFTIKKHVTEVVAKSSEEITINVGETVNLADYYIVNPSDADDKTVNAFATKGEDCVQLGGSGTAWTLKGIKKGIASISVESVDNPQAYTTLTVIINQPATGITVTPNTFDIAVGDELDCSSDMQIKVLPADAMQSYTLSTTNSDIVEVHNEVTRSPYIKGLKKGTATVTVTADDGSGVSTTFTVNVHSALTGFTFSTENVEMSSLTKTVLTITPNPADAIVKDELTATVVKPTALRVHAPTWKYVDAEMTRNASGAYEIELSAYSVGDGLLILNCGNYISDKNIYLHVGFPYNLANGWDWMSVFTDSKNSDAQQTMQDMLGDNLIEARTQDGLLYNDPVYGYFGDFTDFDAANRCYKVKGKAAQTYMLYGNMIGEETIKLRNGWNWVPNNCQYDQTIALRASDGDVILSLTDGFATYTSGAWSPADFKLKAGQGYMFYTEGTPELVLPNPYDCEQPTTIGASLAPARREGRVWQYNPRQFTSVMPVIAEIEGIDADYCTVGAFVGDECRGEGRLVDGKWYITVAGETGEKVSFRVYDRGTETYSDICETVGMASILGSVKAPVQLSAAPATAIRGIDGAEAGAQGSVYNLQGQKVTSAQKGVFIMNGKKVILK